MFDLVQRGDVLVSTVGPFARWGEPVVRAAVAVGAAYLDSTGEPPFIRRVFTEFGAPARHSGSVLMTAMGYDFVPGALAAGLALREAGERAVRVDVGYYALGGGPSSMSRGTRASLAGIALAPSYAFRGGAVRTVRSAERMRTFAVKGKERPAISVGGAEHFTVPPDFGHVREVNVYLGWFGPLAKRDHGDVARDGARRAGCPACATRSSPARASWPRWATRPPRARRRAGCPGSPPPPTTRRASRSRRSTSPGADGYDFTAGMLAWAARRIAARRPPVTGAAGPLEAFGLDGARARLRRGRDHAGRGSGRVAAASSSTSQGAGTTKGRHGRRPSHRSGTARDAVYFLRSVIGSLHGLRRLPHVGHASP